MYECEVEGVLQIHLHSYLNIYVVFTVMLYIPCVKKGEHNQSAALLSPSHRWMDVISHHGICGSGRVVE